MELRDIKGIGPKTEALFHKLGITTPEELIRYYPVGYDEYAEPVAVGAAVVGAKNAVEGVMARPITVRRFRRVQIVTTEISDPTGSLRLTWYNAPFVASTLRRGSTCIFRGVVREKGGGRVMDHPEIFTLEKYDGLKNTLVPVYSLTKGLSGKTVGKAVREALKANLPSAGEYLPESLIRLHGLMDEQRALGAVHFPENADEFTAARSRLVFDEFFLFVLAIRMLKAKDEDERNAFPMKAVWETEEMISRLPFSLTKAQLRVWHEIERDLCGSGRMSRLIQGDVGSGKTILSFLALVMTAANGYQGALMAPTEVLARQHYEKLCRLREEQELEFLRPVLLIGSLKAAERRAALAALQSGEANLAVGTHALIQDAVEYRSLALVVTDEQHRFGVRQRGAFSDKGAPPHTIVMSATPIPRTLGVIFYGDLDISVVDELPARRLPIRTAVVDESYREKALHFIEKQTAEGRQAYVICPMIESSEEFETSSVEEELQAFRKALPDRRIGSLHGRMRPDEKTAVMEEFAEGTIDVLISTTVVEVGVDVPNATVMLVLGAERFGLAQLHQLRGRVGRGEHQSYCIYMAGQQSEKIAERLEILRESNDGFRIAERDFELRGPGDLLGVRQSGDAMFKMADVTRDGALLKLAGQTAASVMEDDPALLAPEHELLKEELRRYLRANERNIVL